jgi:hypothetical protein
VENLFILYIVVAQVFYIKRVIKSPSKHVTLLLEMALVRFSLAEDGLVFNADTTALVRDTILPILAFSFS